MNDSNKPSDNTVSAFIVCLNEERQIRRCLESVKWCDEIVVVDSGSTDRTLEICKEYTNKIVYRSWTGYVEQKRHALSLCSSAWVLNIDADEEVSVELAEELQALVSADNRRYDGYYINRVSFFLNRWWRKGGWYPEYRLRFCRRLATTWGGVDPHEKASVSGDTAKCKGEMFHYSFTGLADFVKRSNTLCSHLVVSMLKRGVKCSVLDLLFRPIARFVKFYFLKRGFREGTAGFIVALIEAHTVFLKYALLWEGQKIKPFTDQEE
jgi:glycosyltransferase involved in cell wall biosynthesis